MQELLMAARSRTDDWRFWHVGELMWGFFMVTCHLNPREHIRLWHDDGGRLVGYAILGEDPSFDCQVLPEYAWSGIETEAMAWAELRLSELRQRDAQRWGGNLLAGARQGDVNRIAFLEQHGFRRGEYAEVNFLRSLDEPIPEAGIPAGYQVRAVAAAGEISDRAAAEHDVWSQWAVGNVSGDDYALLMRLPGYYRELDVVAVAPEGIIAAYVNGWIDPVNRIGDFGPVGARLAYRRQGLTRAVLLECLRRMRARGMDRVCVSTGVTNTPAVRLYESVGFRAANKYLEYVKAR
jgi:ribosomal protein S18 acetylase RimI-like enzyme